MELIYFNALICQKRWDELYKYFEKKKTSKKQLKMLRAYIKQQKAS